MIDGDQPQFEEPRALRLFPTFVWRADFRPGIHQAINQTIIAQLAPFDALLTAAPARTGLAVQSGTSPARADWRPTISNPVTETPADDTNSVAAR